MASANSGNISARLDADTVLITPTLVSKGFMQPGQLLVTTLDLHLIPEAVIFLGEVPLVPFHPPGSPELAEAIVPYLEEYDAVLMENHGVICWGSDVEQAYHRLETVEFCAQVTLTAQLLGGARKLPEEPLENLLKIRKMMKGGG